MVDKLPTSTTCQLVSQSSEPSTVFACISCTSISSRFVYGLQWDSCHQCEILHQIGANFWGPRPAPAESGYRHTHVCPQKRTSCPMAEVITSWWLNHTSEKKMSSWIVSPRRGENKTSLKTLPRNSAMYPASSWILTISQLLLQNQRSYLLLCSYSFH